MSERARWLQMESLDPAGINYDADLPYGLKVDEVIAAMTNVLEMLHDLNNFLVGRGNRRFEEMVLGNSFSGMVSEFMVQAVGRESATLVPNAYVGGHPDLIPIGVHANDSILRGEEGIEIKTSLQPSGWQGHNPENIFVMVFQYSVDTWTEPREEREPFMFEKAMLAELELDDWSFSGRSGASRRTPTASILKSGTDKLHANYIYQVPGYTRRRKRAPSKKRSDQGELDI